MQQVAAHQKQTPIIQSKPVLAHAEAAVTLSRLNAVLLKAKVAEEDKMYIYAEGIGKVLL